MHIAEVSACILLLLRIRIDGRHPFDIIPPTIVYCSLSKSHFHSIDVQWFASVELLKSTSLFIIFNLFDFSLLYATEESFQFGIYRYTMCFCMPLMRNKWKEMKIKFNHWFHGTRTLVINWNGEMEARWKNSTALRRRNTIRYKTMQSRKSNVYRITKMGEKMLYFSVHRFQ